MVDLWVLHIDSLRRTFGQSLMKIFQRVQEIWSGQESVTDRWMDRRTDGQTKAISIIPRPLRGGGLTMAKEKQKIINGNLFLWNLLFSELPNSFLTDFSYQSTLYLAPTASKKSHLSYHNPNQ